MDEQGTMQAPVASQAPENHVDQKQSKFCMKFVFFLIYLVFSIICTGLLFGHKTDDPSCKIKYTYQQLPMMKFLSDPYYVSSGVLRGSPKSLHEVLKGQAAPYSQLLSDVAAFPVGVANPVMNSPFLPIQIRYAEVPWTLNEFLKNSLGRDVASILKQIETNMTYYKNSDVYDNLVIYIKENSNMYSMSNQDLQQTLAVVRKALNTLQFGDYNINTNSIMTSIVEQFLQVSSDVTFYIEKNGTITFPASYGFPAHSDEQDAIIKGTLLGRGMMDPSRGNNMVPNLGRCISASYLNTHELTSGKEALNELVDMTVFSHRKGSCLATSQPLLVDVTSNSKTSLILFSSNNALFFVMVILWISASFYLSSVIVHTTDHWWQNLGAVVLAIWYVVFSIILIICPVVSPHVPVNNVFLGLALGLLSAWYQVSYTLQGEQVQVVQRFKNKFGKMVGGKNAKMGSNAEYQEGFAPLMQLSIQGHDGLSTSLYGMPRVRCNSGIRQQQPYVTTAAGGFNKLTGFLKGSGKVQSEEDSLDSSDSNYEHEWVAMAMTWPLVFVSIACSASPYVTTCSVQQQYVIVLAYFLSNAAFPKHKDSLKKEHGTEIKWLSGSIIVLAMVSSAVAISIFFSNNIPIEPSYTDATVPALSIIAVIWLGIKSFMWFGLGTCCTEWSGTLQEILIALDESVKIVFAAVMIAVLEYGRGSTHNNSCHMWSYDTNRMIQNLA